MSKKTLINISLFIIALIICILILIKNYSKLENEKQTIKINQNKIIENMQISISNLDTLNPLESENKDVFFISKLIYDPLIEIDEKQKVVPSLATEWSNIDGKTFILKLRKDVLWSNGYKFTADEVINTIDYIKALDKSIYKKNVENINNIEKIDDYNLKITLKEKDLFFEYQLTFPIILENEELIGTGKYKLINKYDDKIILSKNEFYWGNLKNEIKKITIKTYDNLGYAYNDFKISNLNLLNISLDNFNESTLLMNYQHQDYIGRNLELLVFNCTKIKDKNIRKYISNSIDKDQINQSVYNNQKYIANFILPPNNWLYMDSLYNNNESLNLSGKLTSYTLMVDMNSESRCNVAEEIKKQLEEKGIKVYIVKLSKTELLNRIKNKNFDIALIGIDTYYSPDLNYYFGNKNLANYENEEIKRILETCIDDVENKYKEIQEVFLEDMPYIPLFFEKNVVVYKDIYDIITPVWNNIFLKI